MDNKHKAKREAIKKLRKIMGDMDGKGLKDGMSAQVIAKDKKGLKEGLEKEGIEEKGTQKKDPHEENFRKESSEEKSA